jgi:PIN domain nuclease of toxin-antitoxin system
MTDDPRLSAKAKGVYEQADQGGEQIVVPCIVFFELLYLVEKGKLSIDFSGFITMVASARNYRVEPLCIPIIERSQAIPRERIADPWDRLIAATSIHLGFPLITRDDALLRVKLKGVRVLW